MVENEETSGTAIAPLDGQVVGKEEEKDGFIGGPSSVTVMKEVSSDDLEELGLMMPLANPAALRAAFAHRQRVLTSILDPEEDFLYAIKFFDTNGKPKQTLEKSLQRAKELTKSMPGATFSAHPVKSGCMKLAHALGIECVLQSRTGLPVDGTATYSACVYVATHKRTNRREEGQGYCDKSERDKAHVIISMADTRAYCHAVLRCAGYSSVGADSLDATDLHEVAVTIAQLPTNEMAQKVRDERSRSLPSESTAPQTVNKAMGDAKKTTAPAAVTAPATAAKAQTAPAQQAPASSVQQQEVPLSGGAEVITKAMAAELSQLILAKLGSKERGTAFLKEHAGVERSIHVPMGKYSDLKNKLDNMQEP